jgi:tetratricopeptide (TPR) repeat protein
MKKCIVLGLLLALYATPRMIQAESTNTLHHYMMGSFQSFQKDSVNAEKHYNKAFEQEISPYAYKGQLHNLYEQKKFAEIVALMPKLETIFKDHIDIQLIFAQSQLQTGDTKGYGERVITLNKKFTKSKEAAFQATQVYIDRKELENALTVINEFLDTNARTQFSFIFHFLKAQIYTQLNKKEEAIKSAHKAIKSNPRFDKAWLLIGLLEEQINNIPNAIDAYIKLLKLSTTNPKLEKHLLHLSFKQHVQKGQTEITINKNCFNQALMLFKEKKIP